MKCQARPVDLLPVCIKLGPSGAQYLVGVRGTLQLFQTDLAGFAPCFRLGDFLQKRVKILSVQIRQRANPVEPGLVQVEEIRDRQDFPVKLLRFKHGIFAISIAEGSAPLHLIAAQAWRPKDTLYSDRVLIEENAVLECAEAEVDPH